MAGGLSDLLAVTGLYDAATLGPTPCVGTVGPQGRSRPLPEQFPQRSPATRDGHRSWSWSANGGSMSQKGDTATRGVSGPPPCRRRRRAHTILADLFGGRCAGARLLSTAPRKSLTHQAASGRRTGVGSAASALARILSNDSAVQRNGCATRFHSPMNCTIAAVTAGGLVLIYRRVAASLIRLLRRR
jgi:hypothetical protein